MKIRKECFAFRCGNFSPAGLCEIPSVFFGEWYQATAPLETPTCRRYLSVFWGFLPTLQGGSLLIFRVSTRSPSSALSHPFFGGGFPY